MLLITLQILTYFPFGSMGSVDVGMWRVEAEIRVGGNGCLSYIKHCKNMKIE